MRFVDNGGVTDPRLNLALEEYLLRHVETEESLVLFYVNEPSVIIGRNQNALEEIDPEFVEANDIHVVRRISGGGAVYHDLGNLNFSFVTAGKDDLHNFAKFTGPVVDSLRRLGVDARLHGRSDIFVGDKKVSGNAQYATSQRMFSHGTLLFDTDLGAMLRAINPSRATIESKAVQSIRNYVINLAELLPPGMTIDDLKTELLRGLFGDGPLPALALPDEAEATVEQLASERYGSWDWTYGRAPAFNIRRSERTPAGKIEALIDVDHGRIKAIKLQGDFSGLEDVAGLEAMLLGVPYDRDSLERAVASLDLPRYIGALAPEELTAVLY
jgi:lipoate---protein ligase